MSKKNQPLVPIGIPLRDLLKHLGLETKRKECLLTLRWEEIVGPAVASHARPSHIKFRKLYLCVDSSSWIQELSFRREELIKTVNKALGEEIIQEIRFRIGPVRGDG